ncbi:DNA repair and recombination protein RadB [Salinarchaeum sp. Harcht-Bsk1]|uniref:DNA repair and recombination protein RadB n=1 Tax=Salinarchaeum sp. Harcht-Bsk1 TaxID=1333523 RepID=UPI000342375D|nr:DNA repair and recombination protein RadB [Salinarchaeum sp. Harcht-Bsk1]AGN01721.1 DNA repair and recombination protein RadB [Salinarchaeum sp. Harcht-Bsk1]
MSDPIPTGCEPLDELLGGGFERGTVTQLYGPPAAGKTNVVLSAAAAVAADGGTTVIVDTEGVSIDRFEQVVGARARPETAPDGPAVDDAVAAADAGAGEDLQTLAERIVVQDALDFAEQREAVKDAEAFAEQADLIALDSATGFYRLQRDKDQEGGEALRAVADQITHLLSLARREDLAVVITNQVYTDPEEDRIHALGGHTLDHWTGTILRIDRFRGGNRRATLEKHRAKPAGETAQFRITDEGLAGTEQDRL